MTKLAEIIGRGLAADRPLPADFPPGGIWYSTDTGSLDRNNETKTAWESINPTSAAPSGAASGVLSGTYPGPTFAVDMATQSELNAVAGAAAADDASHAALTAAHGATGAVVGTTNAQTLTNKTLPSPAITTPTGIVKGDVGLGSVDNTSDAGKPVSTLQAAADAAVQASVDAHVADSSAAHAASAIGFTPNGSIGATDVQAAIQEVRDEASSGMANPMTTAGDLIVGGSGGTATRLGKGGDGQVLTVDPTTHLLIWATPGASSGDVVGPVASVDSEIALYNSTTGKLLKRATTTGLIKATAGVIAAAVANTDYATPDQDTTGKSAKADALNSATTVVNFAGQAAPAAGQVAMASDSTHAGWADWKQDIIIPLGDGTNVIATGLQKLTIECPWAGIITGWAIYGEGSGSIVIDIWKDSYANYPATVADTITASAKPTVTAAIKNENNSLGTWAGSPAGSFAAGDHIKLNVDSVTTFTAVTLVLRVKRTA